MAQRVKNLTAAAQIAAEAWVQSPAHPSGLKDSALLQLWHSSQLWLRLNLAWECPYAAGVATLKKKNPIKFFLKKS